MQEFRYIIYTRHRVSMYTYVNSSFSHTALYLQFKVTITLAFSHSTKHSSNTRYNYTVLMSPDTTLDVELTNTYTCYSSKHTTKKKKKNFSGFIHYSLEKKIKNFSGS